MDEKQNKQFDLNKTYGFNSIGYNFTFYDTDEREIHKKIIHYLVESLANLKLVKDKKIKSGKND